MANDAGASDTGYHSPVLVREVVELLRSSTLVLDGTLGGGGHSAALLDVGVHRVIGVDRDADALREATRRLTPFAESGRFLAIASNYANLADVPALHSERFSGILLDLGISSHQIDDTARGFSFRHEAPLDMRMGADAPETAAELLNERDEAELAQIFRDYGDEPRANRLAREVVRRRATEPFANADHLVNAIRGALGARSGPGDFARLFQAVRIAVNNELTGLERALVDLRDRLSPSGVFAVIAYHSGEDRLVKNAFRDWSTSCVCPPKQPFCTCGDNHAVGEMITRKAIMAGDEEIARNPRARSARLRAWRRAA